MGSRTNAKVELNLAGQWTDITGFVRERDPISISRGKSSQTSSPDPGRLTLTLGNPDGRFSNRNPMSPYSGILGRNTPIRVSLPSVDGNSLWLRGVPDDYVSCPDSAALDIAYLDIRFEAETPTWSSTADLMGKYEPAGDHRSWYFGILRGSLQFIWSVDGTRTNRPFVLSTEKLPWDEGHRAVRATLTVDNGAGGATVTFYYSDSIDGTWTQLGDPVVVAGPSGVYASTAPVEVGRVTSFSDPFYGHVYKAEIRNGLTGTVVASPDFTLATPGSASLTDAQGNLWTLNGMSELTDRLFRFYGEVSKWPQSWDLSGKDRTVKLQAFGFRRRLTLNSPPLRSTMYREYMNPNRTHIREYWPMEDPEGSTSIASGRGNGNRMSVTGSPSLASESSWVASDALPAMGNGLFRGSVPIESITNVISARMFVWVKQAVSTETSLLRLNLTGGSLATWDIRLLPDGRLRTVGYLRDLEGTQLVNETLDSFNINNGGFTILSVELEQVGTGFRWMTSVIDFPDNPKYYETVPYWFHYSPTPVASRTVGNVAQAVVGQDRGLTNVVVGHLAIGDAADTFDTALDWFNPGSRSFSSTAGAFSAYSGETPTDRFARLCSEESINRATSRRAHWTDTGNRMGNQHMHTLVELLDECENTDFGMTTESRDDLSFLFLDGRYLLNQEPKVILDYSSGHIAGDLNPVDDDSYILNDLTIKRVDGSSTHVEQVDGPLSVLSPPEGVGRYTHEEDVSLEDDSMLIDQASWRLHLGTVDEVRYPQLTVALHAPQLSDEQKRQILKTDIGSRIDITGFDQVPGLPPDDVSQIVLGYTENIGIITHEITFNLVSASPYVVGVVDEPRYGRVSLHGSTLVNPIDSTTTSFQVTNGTGGIPWSGEVQDLPYDIRIGGERMTVTGVSSGTVTVVRSVNGTVKSHGAGSPVELFNPAYVSF